MQPYAPDLIWYASDSHARSSLTFLAYQDKGLLSIDDGELSFQGTKHAFRLANIRDVQFVSQALNWPWHIVGGTFAFFTLTWRGVPTFVVGAIIAFILGVGASMVIIGKWVKVDYQTEEGVTEAVWFADGGNLGWSGLLGGNQKLFDVIRATVFPPDASATQQLVLGNTTIEEQCPWCEETVSLEEHDKCPSCGRPI